MSLHPGLVWECRTTGHADNAGGFSAEQIVSDLVIDAVTATSVTSAIRPFVAGDVGRRLTILSGTGFTVGNFYTISAVVGVTATLSAAAGTLGSTGGVGLLSGVNATDYSQQDAPQAFLTDLVIGGAGNETQLTSAARPFVAADAGNTIRLLSGTGFTADVAYSDIVIGSAGNEDEVTSAARPFVAGDVGKTLVISSGTGFTPGTYTIASLSGVTATLSQVAGTAGSTGGVGSLKERAYLIVRVSGTTAILDRAAGTASSTGGVARLGGANSSLHVTYASAVKGNTIWVKSGTYTIANHLYYAITDATYRFPVRIEGYGTTRGDETKATLSASSIPSIIINSGGVPTATTPIMVFRKPFHEVYNIIFDGNTSHSSTGLWLSDEDGAATGGWQCRAQNCIFKEFANYAVRNDGRYSVFRANIYETSFGGYIDTQSSNAYPHLSERCIARDNTRDGFEIRSNHTLYFCIAHGNGFNGFYANIGFAPWMFNCTSYGNTRSGLEINSHGAAASAESDCPENLLVQNCIFAVNTLYGIKCSLTTLAIILAGDKGFKNNAFYGNVLGNYYQVPTGSGDIALTYDPFVGASVDNFALNNNAAAGASLRNGGAPGAFPDGINVGYIDVGAVQSKVAGTGACTYTDYTAEMRSLWRELTNEDDTTVYPDAAVDRYLQLGLEEFNGVVGYFVQDFPSPFLLAAGTGEYDLDCAISEIVWVEWNGVFLKKADMNEWREQNIDWRNAESGTPSEYAVYRDKIIIYPPPNDAVVTQDPYPTIRAVTQPRSITTYGPEQISGQDRWIPVKYGVANWFESANAPSGVDAKRYREEATLGARSVALKYENRRLGK